MNASKKGNKITRSSPRPWGCFLRGPKVLFRLTVFPTPVGVFLFPRRHAIFHVSLPHARGGVSKRRVWTHRLMLSSPRPWGCFHITLYSEPLLNVFPTPVGVFPSFAKPSRSSVCLPHARGGVSDTRHSGFDTRRSSPRPWGCFRFRICGLTVASVFPTPVGVFLPISRPR